jgi:hypothetical protein
VTSAGSVQLAADIPFVDGIESIWTNDASATHVSYRTLRADATARSASFGPHAEMMVQCGHTDFTSCWDYPGGSYCEVHSYPYYCEVGVGGGYIPPDGGGGGGTTPPPTDPEVTQLQNQYANCPPTPAEGEFITSAQYVNPGHFSFDELRDSSYNHAIITGALTAGLEATRTNYGSGITVNSGYRAPGTNAGQNGAASCSDHIRGTAADLNIRSSTGAHDCTIWNALATAGNAAGAWVEPWSELVQRGTPDHVHLDFGRPANQPADYGTCNPTQVAP